MIKILHFLFSIRFRKIVSKDDYFAISMLCFLYIAIAIIVFTNYVDFYNYLFIMLIDILINYLNRKDIDFLKLKKNYKTILFFEYVIYLSPFLIVFLIKKDYIMFFGYIVFICSVINISKINFKTIPYPFQLFNPFWHISFRKYKLVFVLPVALVLIFIAIKHNNENIIYFSFIVLTLISCIPSFERERIEEIKITPFNSKKFLYYQLKNSLINTTYLIIPVVIVLCFLLKWNLILPLLGILIFTLINILLKYVFFSNPFLQQIAFIFFVGLTISLFGVPLLITPYLYKKSIENLNTIKYANH